MNWSFIHKNFVQHVWCPKIPSTIVAFIGLPYMGTV